MSCLIPRILAHKYGSDLTLLFRMLVVVLRHDGRRDKGKGLAVRLGVQSKAELPAVSESFDVLAAQYFAAHAYLSSCLSPTLEPFRHSSVSPAFLLHIGLQCVSCTAPPMCASSAPTRAMSSHRYSLLGLLGLQRHDQPAI